MPSSDASRDRIRRAAVDLLAAGGRDAVSTRAVSAAANVQPAAIYRAFGDMQGLLDVVAEETFARYLEQKQVLPDGGDPVSALRSGWDLHVRFGIENPAVYVLIFSYRENRPDRQNTAAATALSVLRRLMVHVAQAGLLVVPVEQAVSTIHAAGMGAVLHALSLPQADRDNFDSSVLRDAVLDRILSTKANPAAGDLRANAVALATTLAAPDRDVPGGLTPGERLLLRELLNRMASH
ncbi:TetR/AcrR family transcriptional regulator [Jidongwangia harbinensis]|uniref:TetR/AcrR family transcriptional regulator n=1 Tax=Jidongwangia harbinensis TaxID=2878561 RepID=UPI001CDA4803|nr:TetR/AcrR family transcriptional regulator [Jidongwangia harbinensis]MCA2212578.1 TetR/AcrR family transcriptional regulator [Jidongwangia harbinensis]